MRYKELENNEVMYEEFMCDDADIVIVAYGITARIAKSAVKAAREKGVKAGLFRCITLYPFPVKELASLSHKVKRFLSVEMNMGQMVNDVKVATDCRVPVTHYGRTGGVIPTVKEITDEIMRLSEKEG